MLAYPCANKSPIGVHWIPVESSGVQWSPVESYRTRWGRVKPSIYTLTLYAK